MGAMVSNFNVLVNQYVTGNENSCIQRCEGYFPGQPELQNACAQTCLAYDGSAPTSACDFIENYAAPGIGLQYYGIYCGNYKTAGIIAVIVLIVVLIVWVAFSR